MLLQITTIVYSIHSLPFIGRYAKLKLISVVRHWDRQVIRMLLNFIPSCAFQVTNHISAGSATFEVLQPFYNIDKVAYQFQFDAYHGKNFGSITE